VINDGRLTLGDGGKMKLGTDPFPIGMVELVDKKILVRMDQAETTKGKNMVVSSDLHNLDDQAPQPRDWHVEGECAVEAS
jgi:hypothetical protein